MSGRFDGSRVVVTGAAQGIGRAVLRRFSAEGAAALGLDLSEELLRESCEGRPRAEWRAVDVRSDQALAELRAFEADILVNAAGVLIRHEFLEHPVDAWRRTMDINLRAVFRFSRDFARDRVERGLSGAIVNISSIEAFTAAPAHAAYTASKTGIAMMTRSFALELAEHGVRVNAIAPGVTETAMNEALREDDEKAAWLRGLIPVGRFAKPEEQAAVVAFLASDEASYVTGAVLPSDGGWLTQ